MTTYRHLLDTYEDRKRLKWGGFYLSDHTALIEVKKKEASNHTIGRPLMTREAIDQLLTFAQMKQQPIIIQKNEMDKEGYYPDDITGYINGYDSIGLFIGEEKIDYDVIRNVELTTPQKWFD